MELISQGGHLELELQRSTVESLRVDGGTTILRVAEGTKVEACAIADATAELVGAGGSIDRLSVARSVGEIRGGPAATRFVTDLSIEDSCVRIQGAPAASVRAKRTAIGFDGRPEQVLEWQLTGSAVILGLNAAASGRRWPRRAFMGANQGRADQEILVVFRGGGPLPATAGGMLRRLRRGCPMLSELRGSQTRTLGALYTEGCPQRS